MTRSSTSRAMRAVTFILAAALLPVTQLAATEPSAPPESAERLRRGVELIGGRSLYLERCATCHGARGQGSVTVPTDFSAPDALVRLTRESIVGALVAAPHSGLAPLPADERDAIVGYLRNYLMLPAPAADTVAGRAIYARDCSVCHGDRGNAASWAKNSLNPGPADFTAHGLSELTREKMIEAVTFGRSGTAMMGFATQLDRDQIAAAVDYIRAAFMPEMPMGDGHGHDHAAEGAAAHGATDHHAQSHADAGGTFPGGLTGDPVWGKAFYGANCAECHGDAGDGQGRRAYFMIVKPKNFLSRDARAELDREHLFEEIGEGVPGTTMPSWDKVLSAQQIANVAEYVYRSFLRPEEFASPATQVPGWQPAGTQEAGTKKN